MNAKIILFFLLITTVLFMSCEEITGYEPIEWIEVGTEGAPGFQNGWQNDNSETQSMAFGIDQDGFLNIIGSVRDSSPSGSPNIIFTLPEGYRPSVYQYRGAIAWSDNAGASVICTITIETDGDVYIYGDFPQWVYGLDLRVKL